MHFSTFLSQHNMMVMLIFGIMPGIEFVFEISTGDKQGTHLPSASGSSLIDVKRSSGISGRNALAFALSISCQTMCMFEGAWTSKPFHSDEWLFSRVLLPCYEKGDLVIGRLYEAIKNVCQSAASNAILKQRRRVPRVCVGGGKGEPEW